MNNYPVDIPSYALDSDRWTCMCFLRFLQMQANRFAVGMLRYGKPQIKKRYMTRIFEEMAAYERTGNREHLINTAVYCFLESEKPENERAHFDPTVDSVTRKEP